MVTTIQKVNGTNTAIKSDEYKKEKELALLDNLNKLYVAMTRPKERLYIFCKSFPDKIVDDFDTQGKLHSFLHNFSNFYPKIEGNAEENHQKTNLSRSIFWFHR